MTRKRILSLTIIIVLIISAYATFNFFTHDSNGTQSEVEHAEVPLISDELIDGHPVQYGAHKGDMMYDYELENIETGEIVKISDYRGKKVFLNFWVSWCPSCQAEASDLQEITDNNDDIVVLGVNVDDSEFEAGAELDFVEDFGITFVNTYAPEELYDVFPITSFPTSVFINSDGVIEEGVVGPLDRETIESRFNRIE